MMKDRNQKPLNEGNEKKGGMNKPPKNDRPNIKPAGQKPKDNR